MCIVHWSSYLFACCLRTFGTFVFHRHQVFSKWQEACCASSSMPLLGLQPAGPIFPYFLVKKRHLFLKFAGNLWAEISMQWCFIGRCCKLCEELFKGMATTWQYNFNNGAAYTSENTVCSFSSLDSVADKLWFRVHQKQKKSLRQVISCSLKSDAGAFDTD